MILALRPWIVVALMGLFGLSLFPVKAGMTPGEVKAFEGYKVKAEKGDAVAQFQTGVCYDFGEGVAKDHVEAVVWYSKAANTT
jgi:TPR repeat protein